MRLAFSSCPNDTFMFHGIVSGAVPLPGVDLSVVMEDIEALNERALGPRPARAHISKLSVGVLPRAAADYTVLAAGAALGRGCGPLVVARAGGPIETLSDLAGARVAIPGALTTANLLLRIFAPPTLERVPMRFDQIMPAVAGGQVDAGLIIHESRFTYPDHGLACVVDLGEAWEGDTGLPLPLGVIAVDRTVAPAAAADIETALAASVAYARADPSRSRAYVRAHAQEMTDDVCDRHIALYVNEFSVDLGAQGREAIDQLLRRADPDAPSPWR
jgi:1,4-dihydroxy-6-naphthoate synthase